MRLDPDFLTHDSKGEHYLISTGRAKFKGIVQNNETAAFIVECLKNETTLAAVADKVMAEYTGADRATVEKDIAGVVKKLRSIGAIIE